MCEGDRVCVCRCVCVCVRVSGHREGEMQTVETCNMRKRVVLTSLSLSSNPEHVRREASNPGVQGSSHPEITLHSAPLWDLQGRLGLVDSAGDLLRGRHRAL